MTARWRGELVRVVSIDHARGKAKIATARGLRWAHLRDLVTTPDLAMLELPL